MASTFARGADPLPPDATPQDIASRVDGLVGRYLLVYETAPVDAMRHAAAGVVMNGWGVLHARSAEEYGDVPAGWETTSAIRDDVPDAFLYAFDR